MCIEILPVEQFVFPHNTTIIMVESVLFHSVFKVLVCISDCICESRESRATTPTPRDLCVPLQSLFVFRPPSHVRVQQIHQATATGLWTSRPGSKLRWYSLLMLSCFVICNSHLNTNTSSLIKCCFKAGPSTEADPSSPYPAKTLRRIFSLLKSTSSFDTPVGSAIPVHQIISLVSMTTPRTFRPHKVSSSPAFVEFNMSESGYGWVPVLATVTHASWMETVRHIQKWLIPLAAAFYCPLWPRSKEWPPTPYRRVGLEEVSWDCSSVILLLHNCKWLWRIWLLSSRVPRFPADSWSVVYLLVPDQPLQPGLRLPPHPPAVSDTSHVADGAAVHVPVHLLLCIWRLPSDLHRRGGIYLSG